MTNLIGEIIRRQKVEWEKKRLKSYVPRRVLADAKKQLAFGLIKVIVGPRRAGKSVLGAMMLRDVRSAYLNFDEPAFANAVDTESIMGELSLAYGEFDYIFFDEIQNLQGWELFLNRLHREERNVIVTGSNANLLSGELATHLTGRHVSIEVLPFSFSEILMAHTVEGEGAVVEAATSYLRNGGYPEVVMNPGIDSVSYLSTLATAVVSKDIVSRHHVRKVSQLTAVLDWSFSNISKEISYNRLASENPASGLPESDDTVKKYLSHMEDAYLTELVSRYEASFGERVRSPRKLYALDNGIALATGFRTSPDNGRLLENLVYGELRKCGAYSDIRYFRTAQGGKEVDFVLRKGHETAELVQVSWDVSDKQTLKRELAGFAAAAKATRCQKATIVTWLDSGEHEVDGLTVKVVPFREWVKTLG